MMRTLLAGWLFLLLAACSSDEPQFDGNLSGNAAAILDAQANMLEGRADNMVAATEAALTANVEVTGNSGDLPANMADPDPGEN